MKSRYWILLVLSVLVLTILSFLLVFVPGKMTPLLGNIPYAFWTSFLITCIVVVLTFVGSQVFPHHEQERK